MNRIRTAPEGPSEVSRRMLDALQGHPLHQGTASAGEVARHHAANRAAKAARRRGSK